MIPDPAVTVQQSRCQSLSDLSRQHVSVRARDSKRLPCQWQWHGIVWQVSVLVADGIKGPLPRQVLVKIS